MNGLAQILAIVFYATGSEDTAEDSVAVDKVIWPFDDADIDLPLGERLQMITRNAARNFSFVAEYNRKFNALLRAMQKLANPSNTSVTIPVL